MEINVDLLDSQEPADYVIAVQMAWDMIPEFWRSLFPSETMFFLSVSSTDWLGGITPLVKPGSTAIVILIPSGDFNHDQIVNASLFSICIAILATDKVHSVVYEVARRLLKCFDFTPEEEGDIKNPQFVPQLFVQALLAYVICIPGEKLEDEFGRSFINMITEMLETSEGRT